MVAAARGSFGTLTTNGVVLTIDVERPTGDLLRAKRFGDVA
jgi:hypothetical protein